MGIEAQGKMVEQVDRDDKKEDKAANEVVDNVLTSTLATTACTGLYLKNSKAAPPKMLRLIQNQLFESICARNICLRSAHGYTRHTVFVVVFDSNFNAENDTTILVTCHLLISF